MNTELLFIYDTHCPWSYAVAPLINEINQHFPNIKINYWHNAVFSQAEYGEINNITREQLDSVKQASTVNFSDDYIQSLSTPKDSTLAANLLAWTNHKAANKTLPLLNALQEAHFQQGIALTNIEQIQTIIDDLKLSPPTKVLKNDKLSKDAEFDLHEIFAIQDIINTKAIPALLLVHGDNLILLNHHLYLPTPYAIVEAIKLELNTNESNK
jgi:protein-disulfide isomerase-like protein with CxxC motif